MRQLSETRWIDFSEQMKYDCMEQHIPQGATFELTPLCNFNCKMCYVRLNPEQMSCMGNLKTADEWLALGRQAIEAGTLFLLLTGGEPFIRKDFCEIYEGLCEMGFLITIYSNGYLITDKVIEWLKEKPPIKLRITLYGMSDETYKKVCGVSDGFTVVRNNILKLRQAGVLISLAMTIIKDNAHDLDAARDWAKEMNIEFRYTREIVKPVRGAESDAQQVRFIMGSLSEKPDKDFPRVKALYPHASNNAMDICGSKNRCFWVDWNGRMSMCSLIGSIYEEPFKDGLIPAWNKLCERMERLKKPEKCIDCKYQKFCTVCPGVLEAETGDPELLDETICAKAKARYHIYSIDEA